MEQIFFDKGKFYTTINGVLTQIQVGGFGGGTKRVTNIIGGGGSLLFNSTVDKQVVTNNATPISILPTTGIGSSIIPANFLTNGKKLSIRIGGTIFAENWQDIAFGSFNPNWNFAPLFVLKVGGQDVLANEFLATSNISPNTIGFLLIAELTYRSTGSVLAASGSVDEYNIGQGMLINPNPIVINPSIPNAVDITASLSPVTITTKIMSIESPTLIS